MNAAPFAGTIYFCPVCGAEIAVIGGRNADFHPRCCNTEMAVMKKRGVFYFCPVCGSRIISVQHKRGDFTPRCCNRPMQMAA